MCKKPPQSIHAGYTTRYQQTRGWLIFVMLARSSRPGATRRGAASRPSSACSKCASPSLYWRIFIVVSLASIFQIVNPSVKLVKRTPDWQHMPISCVIYLLFVGYRLNINQHTYRSKSLNYFLCIFFYLVKINN